MRFAHSFIYSSWKSVMIDELSLAYETLDFKNKTMTITFPSTKMNRGLMRASGSFLKYSLKSLETNANWVENLEIMTKNMQISMTRNSVVILWSLLYLRIAFAFSALMFLKLKDSIFFNFLMGIGWFKAKWTMRGIVANNWIRAISKFNLSQAR